MTPKEIQAAAKDYFYNSDMPKSYVSAELRAFHAGAKWATKQIFTKEADPNTSLIAAAPEMLEIE